MIDKVDQFVLDLPVGYMFEIQCVVAAMMLWGKLDDRRPAGILLVADVILCEIRCAQETQP